MIELSSDLTIDHVPAWTMTRRIVAVDPGKMSGVVFGTVDGGELNARSAKAWEVETPKAWHLLEMLLDEATDLVWETFTVTSRTAKLTPAPWSTELIGWMRGTAHSEGIARIAEQKPGDAKGLCSDEWLRERGLWVRGGAGHARDAARHLGFYVAKTWGMSAIPLQSA